MDGRKKICTMEPRSKILLIDFLSFDFLSIDSMPIDILPIC